MGRLPGRLAVRDDGGVGIRLGCWLGTREATGVDGSAPATGGRLFASTPIPPTCCREWSKPRVDTGSGRMMDDDSTSGEVERGDRRRTGGDRGSRSRPTGGESRSPGSESVLRGGRSRRVTGGDALRPTGGEGAFGAGATGFLVCRRVKLSSRPSSSALLARRKIENCASSHPLTRATRASRSRSRRRSSAARGEAALVHAAEAAAEVGAGAGPLHELYLVEGIASISAELGAGAKLAVSTESREVLGTRTKVLRRGCTRLGRREGA